MVNTAKRPSSKTSSKTTKNTVGVQVVKGMIRLSLPREISRAAHGKPQQFISPGLPANDINIQAMRGKAAQISADIATGNYDPTWEKYQLGVVAANKLTAIDGGKKPEPTVLELWEKFKEYKKPNLAETTFKRKWANVFTKAITRAVEQTDNNPVSIRNHIISNWCKANARDTLSALEQAYQWGIQHEMVAKNPFLGMSKEIDIKKKETKNDGGFDEFEDTRAFTTDEMNAIIEYFENTPTVEHWANYVKFLFYTGCRPGEAAALRWKHVSPDCSRIRFSQSYDAQYKITKSTKTDTIRIFPCHVKLKKLLLSIKPDQTNAESLVFTSKTGRQIAKYVFYDVWKGQESKKLKGVIPTLIGQGKVRQYLKPYATRHTFITYQVDGGIPAHVIAGWVGNSADIIWKHYYQHQQNVPPINM